MQSSPTKEKHNDLGVVRDGDQYGRAFVVADALEGPCVLSHRAGGLVIC